MEDSRIVDLYWERNEDAIKETDKKYGNYCFSCAFNILFDSPAILSREELSQTLVSLNTKMTSASRMPRGMSVE